jgi:hypothetical protein
MPVSVPIQTTLFPAADVLFEDLHGEAVALNLTSGKYYGFDDVATRMWTLLAAGKSRPQAVDALLAEYAVERPQLERDLDAFVAQLARHGLLAAQDQGRG